MHIHTIRFPASGIDYLENLSAFFSRTAFIISHKNESLETLLGVLWYLPSASSVIIVTNCSPEAFSSFAEGLYQANRDRLFLIHQKDERIAAYFRERGVDNLLGRDGLVVDGKGEGMYIGALCAAFLGSSACEWVIFYDADNFVPSALLEYTIAMARLFLVHRAEGGSEPVLHNVRICWSSKPSLDQGHLSKQVLGRCSQVISPLVSALFREVGGSAETILTSNAGEQGFTLKTAQTLPFSSRYSVETFQLLDLFARSRRNENKHVLFQQYQAQSSHFHQKGSTEHIKQMIAESLGCFAFFMDILPPMIGQEIHQICTDMEVALELPCVYPPLDEIGVQADPALLHHLSSTLPSLRNAPTAHLP